MSKNNHRILQYYAQQSVITDPSTHFHLFENLPHDLPNLAKTVQGLVISLPWEDAYGLDAPRERHYEIYLRTVPEMLRRILELDSSPLTLERPPQKRRVSLCRDFAVLLVSMLRHQSVPARVRVGFAGYYRAETSARTRGVEFACYFSSVDCSGLCVSDFVCGFLNTT